MTLKSPSNSEDLNMWNSIEGEEGGHSVSYCKIGSKP